MSRFFSGKVSVKAFQIGCPIEFTQKGSRYIHSAVFDGLLEANGGLEAHFIFPRFKDFCLGIFRLPVVVLDNDIGYVDFSNVAFGDELLPYKPRNKSKEYYDRICEILLGRRL
ncbi:hypothetical protein HYV88_05895 [Candidatus Woesearchaeota archaeon]|nr:hypothetical protein [Candidatus Woesearchaeota archaeon]